MFPIPARPGGRRTKRWPTFHHNATPQARYTQTQTVPLMRQGQTIIGAGGTGQVSMGPSGIGSKWYPQSATFATNEGPADGSVAAIYLGFVSASTLLNGALYNGGGDSAGISLAMMTPGDVLVAEWVNAIPGSTAQLTIYGTQDALVTG